MGDYTNINGSILAVGTEQDSIFITSGQPNKSPGDWGSIPFHIVVMKRSFFNIVTLGTE